jgi:peptide subunit release factor 1 (eRF1)
MSKELAARVAGTMAVSVDAAEHEVLDEAEKVMLSYNSLSDLERIEQLKEQNYDRGLGVTSLEKVLAALLNGQVQELYLVSDPDIIEYNVGQVNKLFKDYSPGVDEELPSAKRSALVIEEALRLASQTADDIRFIEDASLLEGAGGVGALLRYQAKGVNV